MTDAPTGPEYRLDPLTREWVLVVGHRQGRPNLPTTDCPFCPGGLEAPAAYDVFAFTNRWPSLAPGAPIDLDALAETGTTRAPGVGAAEVVLYSPEHDGSLATIGPAGVRRVVDLWAERTAVLLARPEVRTVLVFENRGAEVGATIPHPHGQIYGLGLITPVQRREAQVAAAHGCAVCSELSADRADGSRVVRDASGWVATVPYAAAHPYALLLAPQEHVGSLPDLDDASRDGLAAALVDVVGRYDRLFDAPFPYMMWIHQETDPAGPGPGNHLHVHFAPPLRAAGVARFVAAAEVGTGTLQNPVTPETAAAHLRGA
ncbi:MAG: galactose-1-phosphate uridylyltransferase [Actinomycetes bacterium]